MRPVDIATDETCDFIRRRLAGGRLRLLEIGCGAGDVALRLQQDGHEVIAIDAAESAVASARARGVDATLARWPDFDAMPFDVILFTRSLHHLQPLHDAVARAAALLKPSGLLIVEDFAFTDVQPEAAAWFHRLLMLLELLGDAERLSRADGTFGRRLLNAEGAVELWHEHVHELHSAEAMVNALTRHFDLVEIASAPYLYRYVAQMVTDDADGAAVTAGVLRLEQATGAMNAAFLIGRRFVARPRGGC